MATMEMMHPTMDATDTVTTKDGVRIFYKEECHIEDLQGLPLRDAYDASRHHQRRPLSVPPFMSTLLSHDALPGMLDGGARTF